MHLTKENKIVYFVGACFEFCFYFANEQNRTEPRQESDDAIFSGCWLYHWRSKKNIGEKMNKVSELQLFDRECLLLLFSVDQESMIMWRGNNHFRWNNLFWIIIPS